MNKQNLREKWDWALLYYIGTVVLNMTEEEFWKCTPRRLFALLKVHTEVKFNVQDGSNITDRKQAVQQFMSW